MTQSDMEPDPDSTFINDDERNHHNKVCILGRYLCILKEENIQICALLL